MDRIALVTLANKAANESRNPGAPVLMPDSHRETVAEWLQWNDPNGCHTDALAALEQADPYDDETVWEVLAEMLSDY